MLLREMLVAECGEIIFKIVGATTLPKNNSSRDRVVFTIVRSMKMSGVKEPSHCPLYIMAEAISLYQKSNTWPARFPEFIDEMGGLTKLPISTIRSSLHMFPWDVPKYLQPKGRKPAASSKVTILKEKDIKSPLQVERDLSGEDVDKVVCNVKATPLVTKEMGVSPKSHIDETIKLNDNYHVVIDFGAFKITIEKVK